MNTRFLVAALLSLIPTMILADQPTDGTGSPRGVLTALVMHSETYVGLEGMPVYVSKSKASDGSEPEFRGITGKHGIAQGTGLLPGEYSVWVSYNNHTSEVATFTIDEYLTAKAVLFFNPDID